MVPDNLTPPIAIVLTSGGLDSTVCLAVAQSQGYAIHALSFDYGQRHRRELEAARKQARHFNAQAHVVATLDLRTFGNSALTADIAVPKADVNRSGIPITYVPARNTLFLSYALAWAEVLNADAIFIGVNAVDYSGYPDCRPEFIEAFEKLARLATKAGTEGWKLTVKTPLLHMNKAEIIDLGHKLGVDFGATWSCYDPQPNGQPCQQCDSCALRAAGFAKAGRPDPLVGPSEA